MQKKCEKTKRAPGVFVDSRERVRKVGKKIPFAMHVMMMMMMMMRGVAFAQVARSTKKKKDHKIRAGSEAWMYEDQTG